jgi:uncharacterized membrane protein
VAPDRFPTLVVAVAYVLSLPVFVAWPGPAPGGLGGWLVRSIAAFGLPTVALALVLLFGRMGRKGPFQANLERFQRIYRFLLDAAVVLVVGLHLTVMAYVLAGRVWLGTVAVLFLGSAVVFVGNLLPTIKPGSAIGIRTPWTLRDEQVWRRIHRLGGYVVVVAGLALMAAAVLAFQWTWAALAGGMAAAAVGLPAASYVMGRRRPVPQKAEIANSLAPNDPGRRSGSGD